MSALSTGVIKRLMEAALRAQRNAYAPGSNYRVGAAVMAGSGRIYAGCNVEPPTLINPFCAERNAIGNAITNGERTITAVCTASRSSVPCGSCRQLILEFSKGDTPIVSLYVNPKGRVERTVRTTIRKLLPCAHTELQISRNRREIGAA